MSVAILISGTIFKEPHQRTSASGRRYVATTIKAAAADNASSDFWSALAFGSTAGEELMRLAVGERVAVQGSLKLDTYTANDGTTKISRTVFVDHVLAVRQPPKERKPKAATGAPVGTISPITTTNPDLDDEIPF
jgi:single-stranded DNA-binding protein